MSKVPRIGLGVIILNEKGFVLVGKRKGSHAPYYSIPGGYLELGETFLQGVWREVKEETGLMVITAELFGVTNNLRTYEEENIHTISLIHVVREYHGTIQNREPEKCEGWFWADPSDLPRPHFEASEIAILSFFRNESSRRLLLQSVIN